MANSAQPNRWNVGGKDGQSLFSDPLWVAHRIVNSWQEGSGITADDVDAAERSGNADVLHDRGDEGNRGDTLRGGNAYDGLEPGGQVTIGDVTHCLEPSDQVGENMPTLLKPHTLRPGDKGSDLLLSVANDLRRSGVAQFHMQRIEGGPVMCSYETADGQRLGLCVHNKKQDRQASTEPIAIAEAAAKGVNEKKKKKKKSHRDSRNWSYHPRVRNTLKPDARAYGVDGEQEKAEDDRHEEGDDEERDGEGDGEGDEEGEGERDGERNGANEETANGEGNNEEEGGRKEGEGEEEKWDKSHSLSKRVGKRAEEDAIKEGVKGLESADERGKDVDKDVDMDKDMDIFNEARKESKKKLNVDGVINALTGIADDEIQKRLEKISQKTLEISTFEPSNDIIEQGPMLVLRTAIGRILAWEKNQQVVTFQLFIWGVALVNAYERCIQSGVEGKKILAGKVGYPYTEVPDPPDKAFISAANKWLEEEGIVVVTRVFNRHLKVGKRLKQLVESCSEAILLFNYEDEGLEFLSKSGIDNINKDDWQSLTAALSDMRENSPPVWIECKLPPYARYILGLVEERPIAGKDPTAPMIPSTPIKRPHQNLPPTPDPTPQKSATATHPEPNTLNRLNSTTAWYNDDCFYILLHYTTLSRTDVRYISSLYLPKNPDDTDPDRLEPQTCKLFLEPSHMKFVAPVNRSSARILQHWVAYAGRRNGDGTWSWLFADSMGGEPRKYETERIAHILELPIPDFSSVKRNVSIPRQQDHHNCGPFSLEWVLKFINGDDTPAEQWDTDPTEIRRRHFRLAKEALESGKVPLNYPLDTTVGENAESSSAKGMGVGISNTKFKATAPARQLFIGEGQEDLQAGEETAVHTGGNESKRSEAVEPLIVDRDSLSNDKDTKRGEKRSVNEIEGSVREEEKFTQQNKKRKVGCNPSSTSSSSSSATPRAPQETASAGISAIGTPDGPPDGPTGSQNNERRGSDGASGQPMVSSDEQSVDSVADRRFVDPGASGTDGKHVSIAKDTNDEPAQSRAANQIDGVKDGGKRSIDTDPEESAGKGAEGQSLRKKRKAESPTSSRTSPPASQPEYHLPSPGNAGRVTISTDSHPQTASNDVIAAHGGEGHMEAELTGVDREQEGVKMMDNGKGKQKEKTEAQESGASAAGGGDKDNSDDEFRASGQSRPASPTEEAAPGNQMKDNNLEKGKGKRGRKRKVVKPDLGKKCGEPLRKSMYP
ncbi:hypothetical protein HK097_007345 [Rhizophlyctis rosea]|uniref:Ubiquitin-like protease family profile domain-containing protein n=1 Tax=Rhizophlyctis rosea TaxID=64517 RepID=A0AAD5SD71_9FUNG|nr:hypothetical protein HK097_007345 [Rhizophlyctis rosea]